MKNVMDMIETAIKGANSHEEMNNIIALKLEEAKAFKDSIKPLTEEQEYALIGFLTIYVRNYQEDKNPLKLFEIFKRENYEFKGTYAPLNQVGVEQVVKYMFDNDNDTVTVASANTETNAVEGKISEGDYLMYKCDYGESYVLADEITVGTLNLWSEREGRFKANMEKILYVVNEPKEKIVAEIVACWGSGSIIYLYDDKGVEIENFKPVATSGGHSWLLLNVETNELSNEIYGSIEVMAWALVNAYENIESVEVY